MVQSANSAASLECSWDNLSQFIVGIICPDTLNPQPNLRHPPLPASQRFRFSALNPMMIFLIQNLNLVIDARRRWQGRTCSSLVKKSTFTHAKMG
jgi:hypothetical protein